MDKLEWTGERYVPWADKYMVAYEHLHRYGFAKDFVKDKKVLDLASGEGYGSFILSETAESVIGIDIDDLCIRHASSKYLKDNLKFIKGSVTQIPIEENHTFDVIVCFEILEHIEGHEELMQEVKRLIKSDGVFIVSTPNKYIYSDQRNYHNPFHVKELYLEDFRKYLSDNFTYNYIYGLKVFPCSNIFPLFKNSSCSRDFVIENGSNNEFFFLAVEEKIAPYLIAVASDADFSSDRIIGNSYLIDQSESIFRQKNGRIDNLERVIKQKDEVLKQKDNQFRQKCEELIETDNKFKAKCLEVVTKDKELMRLCEERSTEKKRLEEELRQKDTEIKKMDEWLKEKEQLLRQKDKEITDLLESKSWKLTAPVRTVYSLFKMRR